MRHPPVAAAMWCAVCAGSVWCREARDIVRFQGGSGGGLDLSSEERQIVRGGWIGSGRSTESFRHASVLFELRVSIVCLGQYIMRPDGSGGITT